MGNRANIEFALDDKFAEIYVYLYWYGGPESVVPLVRETARRVASRCETAEDLACAFVGVARDFFNGIGKTFRRNSQSVYVLPRVERVEGEENGKYLLHLNRGEWHLEHFLGDSDAPARFRPAPVIYNESNHLKADVSYDGRSYAQDFAAVFAEIDERLSDPEWKPYADRVETRATKQIIPFAVHVQPRTGELLAEITNLEIDPRPWAKGHAARYPQATRQLCPGFKLVLDADTREVFAVPRDVQ